MSALLSTAAVSPRFPAGWDPWRATWDRQKPRPRGMDLDSWVCALGGIRTPNLLIRSQMLYPLSYERIAGWNRQVEPENVSADGLR